MVGSVLILGASGRIGRMLRHHGLAGVAPLWQFRTDSVCRDAIIFDPLGDELPKVKCDAVLCLSGVINPETMTTKVNCDLAAAALRVGVQSGARRVFLASSAAVYGRGAFPFSEDAPARPVSNYGYAKAQMEDSVLRLASEMKQPITVLRIGNVAGADALLGQPRQTVVALDRFADGLGPLRSYIGPCDLANVIAVLLEAGAAGREIPPILNLALPGAVAMADLLVAAGRRFTWRPAPEEALQLVALDTTRLSQIVELPDAKADRIVSDFQSYCAAAA